MPQHPHNLQESKAIFMIVSNRRMQTHRWVLDHSDLTIRSAHQSLQRSTPRRVSRPPLHLILTLSCALCISPDVPPRIEPVIFSNAIVSSRFAESHSQQLSPRCDESAQDEGEGPQIVSIHSKSGDLAGQWVAEGVDSGEQDGGIANGDLKLWR